MKQNTWTCSMNGVFNSSLDLLVLRPRGSHRHLQAQHPYALPNEVLSDILLPLLNLCISVHSRFPALGTLCTSSRSFTHCIINTSTHYHYQRISLILALDIPFKMNKSLFPSFIRRIHIPKSYLPLPALYRKGPSCSRSPE